MPTKYRPEFIHDCNAIEMRPHQLGQWYHATDYAALEARLASLDQKFMVLQGSHDLLVQERDEWKRRCEAMVAMAAPGTKPCNCIDEHGPDENCEHCEDRDHYGDSCEWYGQYAAHTRILAIAEGRDNG